MGDISTIFALSKIKYYMTYREISNLVVDKMKPLVGESEARGIQRYLFEGLNAEKYTSILLNYDQQAEKEFEIKAIEALRELLLHRPIQYVLGFAWFCDMIFNVTEDVLIPRPETEQLVKMIVDDLTGNNQSVKSVLDIGTGSGVIAVSLSKLLNASLTVGIDISEKAIKIAIKNALQNHATIIFILQDIFNIDDGLHNDTLAGFFDIIVSNPPYVKHSESELMSKNVLNYEPHIALFVNNQDPLIYYKAITKYANRHLNQDGSLWFEINENEGYNLVALLEEEGFKANLYNDFNDKPRFIRARRI